MARFTTDEAGSGVVTYSKRRRGNGRSTCKGVVNDTAGSLARFERESAAGSRRGVSGTCASGIPSTGADQAALVSSTSVGLEETLSRERPASPSWGWCAAGSCARWAATSGVLDEIFDACVRAG